MRSRSSSANSRQEGLPVAKVDQKYVVYQDTEQWIPFFNWFWYPIVNGKAETGPDGMGYGAYPAKWIATLLAWWHTR